VSLYIIVDFYTLIRTNESLGNSTFNNGAFANIILVLCSLTLLFYKSCMNPAYSIHTFVLKDHPLKQDIIFRLTYLEVTYKHM